MSVFRTLLKMNLVTALVLLIGIANNVAIAGFFGLTWQVDAYYAAIVLPTLFMAVFVDYLGKNFLPAYAELKNQDGMAACDLTSSTINIIALIVGLVTVLLCVFAFPIFATILPGFSDEELREVCRMFYIIAPTTVLITANTFTVYVCQYHGKFVQVVLCKMMLPLGILVSMLTTRSFFAEYSLPVGYLLGYLLMFIFLQLIASYRYTVKFDYKTPHIRRIFYNSSILVSFGTLARSQQLFEKYFGSLLGAGSISAMVFASRICDPLENKALSGVRAIAFTRGSKLQADNEIERLCDLNTRAILSIYIVILPVLCWLALYSDVLIKLLFGRGEFDEGMAQLVTLALIGLLPNVVIRGTSQIVTNIYYVSNMIMVPAVMGALGTLLFIAIAFFGVERFGILGLALAHTLSNFILFIVFVAVLARKVEHFSSGVVLGRLFYYTLVSITVFWAVDIGVSGSIGNGLLVMGTSLAIGMACYALLLAVARDSNLAYLWSRVVAR